ncbi:MAG: alpha-amylase family glycosyl hydrolase, partial [Bacteroidota bacterium]
MRNKIFILIFFYLITNDVFSQEINLKRVEPPFWWSGFKNRELQVMVYGRNISKAEVKVRPGALKLISIHKTENPNYLFLDFTVQEIKKEEISLISFISEGKVVGFYDYHLKIREKGSAERQGFNSSDAIYLVMPDRFSNGDTANDNIPGMKEKCNRSNPNGRHGGDIKGISNHLDYIKDLGTTALWINPLLENNMDIYSYHGYSITDYYKIDPRYGRNEDYINLSNSLHHKGIKLIMDMVFNHIGSEHW